jgi:hypothetical protein
LGGFVSFLHHPPALHWRLTHRACSHGVVVFSSIILSPVFLLMSDLNCRAYMGDVSEGGELPTGSPRRRHSSPNTNLCYWKILIQLFLYFLLLFFFFIIIIIFLF